MSAPAVVLEARGLAKRYRRGVWALAGVDVSVPVGSITALVGPNGSGKSTLIRTCLGFEVPDAGSVLVCGIDPRRRRSEAVAAVGYVPQTPSLYRNLSIADHLAIAQAARPSFDAVYAALRVGRAGLSLRRRVGELSGGEQAQVALALALGTRAPLLLLDEPLASLDPLARRDFLAGMVVDVRRRGATAVLSSHLVADVEQICDRLVVLVEGRVVLASAVAAAREAFRILPTAELDGQTVVGTFSGSYGQPLALVRGSQLGRPATLEEIVLGHLAAGRADRAEAA